VADTAELPKLPVRAAIYVLPDGTVQFGALFEDLLPIASALGTRYAIPTPSEVADRVPETVPEEPGT
jgi:hypothetical protein